jgi:hypothetical protein
MEYNFGYIPCFNTRFIDTGNDNLKMWAKLEDPTENYKDVFWKQLI